MDNILDHLADYQQNQLLTSSSLNVTTDFLEQRERLTCFGFTKNGIISGLNYSINSVDGKNAEVVIENGFGSSIDGYFMHHNYPEGQIKYAYCRPYGFINGDSDLDFNVFSQTPFQKDKKDTAIDSNGIIAFELLTESEKDKQGVIILEFNSITKDHLLALFLEIKSEGLPECSPTSCDEGGKIKRFRPVPLLIKNLVRTKEIILNEKKIPEEGLIDKLKTPAKNDEVAGLKKSKISGMIEPLPVGDRMVFQVSLFPEINKWQDRSDYIKIKRLSNLNKLVLEPDVLKKDSQYLAEITLLSEVNALNLLNGEVILEALERISENGPPFIDPYFLNVLGDPRGTIGLLKELLKTEIPSSPFPAQYIFDLFADLELAVNEYAQQYNFINDKYFTSYEGRKRRFLVLGLAGAPDIKKDPYRYYPINHYENDLLSSGLSSELKKLKNLYSRIFRMISNFYKQYQMIYADPLKNEKPYETKIIPGKTYNVSLGERAIPFYYGEDESFENIWRLESNERPGNININNYFKKGSEEYLTENINENNFFRIEGVIGKNIKTVHNEIIERIRDGNAPFNVICLEWSFYLWINLFKDLIGKMIKQIDSIIESKEAEQEDIASLDLSATFLRKQMLCNPYIDISYDTMSFIDLFMSYYTKKEFKGFDSLNEYFTKVKDLYQKKFAIENVFTNVKAGSESTIIMRAEKNQFKVPYNLKKVPYFHGMEHIGGVYKGCTYILVYITMKSSQIVIADFQVPYMIEMNEIEYLKGLIKDPVIEPVVEPPVTPPKVTPKDPIFNPNLTGKIDPRLDNLNQRFDDFTKHSVETDKKIADLSGLNESIMKDVNAVKVKVNEVEIKVKQPPLK